jgi:hypothetical protein
MQHVDVTHAILAALANAYPGSIAREALADLVSCEPDALRGQLRLLRHAGAIQGDDTDVRISDAAAAMLRRGALRH